MTDDNETQIIADPQGMVPKKYWRPNGIVASTPELHCWIASMRADDLFHDWPDPMIVLTPVEAELWSLREKLQRPICARLHGVRVREEGHEDMPDPVAVPFCTVDLEPPRVVFHEEPNAVPYWVHGGEP